MESRISGNAEVETTETVDFAVGLWAGTSPVLIAGGCMAESAKRAGGGVCGARGGECVWEVLYQEPGLALSGAEWGGVGAVWSEHVLQVTESRGVYHVSVLQGVCEADY